MAKILVVDDDPNGREYLIHLLSHFDHHVLEASDGKEALAEARAYHPDLIFTDIIMPTMDGYEFVRRLREDPALSATPVVFYSASYRELEALALARACGVTSVLTKPADPEAILRTVNTVLGSAVTNRDFPSECVVSEDLGLLTDALRKTVVERTGLNARLASLIQVGMNLTLQHDPEQLLGKFCNAARDLCATRHAVIGVIAEGGQSFCHYLIDGLDASQACNMIMPSRPGGHLATLLPRDRAGPVRGRRAEAEWLGLPRGFPPVDSYLGVPVFVGERVYGWLCLLNKLGADQFDREDERLAVTLAAQLAVAYENTILFTDLQARTVRVEEEIGQHELSKAALLEGSTLDSLDVDVARALVTDAPLQEILQECTAALVTHLHAAFARIWTFNEKEKMLELQASAGMYTHLDVPLGKFRIGRIAEERHPHLTNSVIGDPRVPEQEWARREGLVVFAGYPLVADDTLVGVMAMFSRKALSEAVFSAMGSVANGIALCIKKKNSENELRQSDARKAAILDSAQDGIITMDAEGEIIEFNVAAEGIFGKTRRDMLGRPLAEAIIPPAWREKFVQGLQRYLTTGQAPVFGERLELPALRADGTEFPAELTIRPVRDIATPLFTMFIRDLTETKQALQRLEAHHAVTRVLAEADSLEAAAPRIIEAVCKSLGWETGLIWNLDPEKQVLRFVEAWRAPGPIFDEFLEISRKVTFAPKIGLPGRVWSSGQVAWIPDVVQDGNFQRAAVAGRSGLHSGLGFPLRLGDDVLGVIEFFSKKIEAPDKELLEMLAAIGSQVGQFIHRKRADLDLRQTNVTLSSLFRALPLAVITLDVEGKVRTWSSAAERLFGWKAGEVVGVQLPIIPPECFAKFYGASLGGSNLDGFEIVGLRKDGSRLDVSLWTAALQETGGRVTGTIRILADATKRKEAESALRAAKESAEETSRAKSGFLAVISHEFRTPMNGIFVMTELLAESELNEDQREFVEIAHRSADHMLTLITDLLDFTMIEADKLKIEKAPLDLLLVVEEVVGFMATQAHEKNLEIVASYAPGTPRKLNGDDVRLRQVLMNLVGNAIKFTARGHVLVSACSVVTRDGASHLRLTVEDTGIGIPEDKLELIFEKFNQIDSSSTRNYEGMGMGLAISKQLVELMGGKIRARSHPGKGSVFEVDLSLLGEEEGEEVAAPCALPDALQGLCVLIASSCSALRQALQEQISSWGLEVKSFASLGAARSVLEGEIMRDPFVLLVDPSLTAADWLIEAEQAALAWPEAIVVVLVPKDAAKPTGLAPPVQLMTKPVCPSRLLDELKELCGAHRKSRALELRGKSADGKLGDVDAAARESPRRRGQLHQPEGLRPRAREARLQGRRSGKRSGGDPIALGPALRPRFDGLFHAPDGWLRNDESAEELGEPSSPERPGGCLDGQRGAGQSRTMPGCGDERLHPKAHSDRCDQGRSEAAPPREKMRGHSVTDSEMDPRRPSRGRSRIKT